MSQNRKLNSRDIRKLPTPQKGSKLHMLDPNVPGFSVRIGASGSKTFCLRYAERKAGRARLFTIGSHSAWSLEAAKIEARKLRRAIESGADPMQERQEVRQAPTMADLAQRFQAEHLPKLRPSTQREYRERLKKTILPKLGKRKVADLRFTDIDAFHQSQRRTPYQANRTLAIVSKMLNLAIRWEYRSDNPCRGVQKFPEAKRKRYLSPEEIIQLSAALAEHEKVEPVSANLIRFLLLTGARRGETFAARWSQFDFGRATWTKPASVTKQGEDHHTPLTSPALEVLAKMRRLSDGGPYVFPGRVQGQPLTDIKRSWDAVTRAAGLENVRVHDLRHSYASVLVSAGMSLPIISGLLGHSRPETTARYSHLYQDVLRAAADRAAALISPRAESEQSADVVELRR